MRDLSEEGFAIRAMVPLRAGEKTPFSFSLNESVRIEGEGEIVWIEENGRVAGIRFTEIPSPARTHIQNWLNGTLETTKASELPEASVVAEAPSFDQLREELRASPPRQEALKPVKAEELSPPPELVPVAPEVLPEPAPPEPAPPGWSAAMPEEVSKAPEPEPLTDSRAFPGLPRFSSNQDAIEISFEAVAPAKEAVQDDSFSAQPRQRVLAPPLAEEEKITLPGPSGLPDISEILIQPPSQEAAKLSSSSVLEPLDPSHRETQARQASWTDWFTLSRALAIMIVLTLMVALSAYHRAAGEALIWLGEQMGGTPVSPSATPASKDDSASGIADQPSSIASDASPQAPSSPLPRTSQDATNAPAAHGNSNPQTSVSSLARSPVSPATPLPGISSPSSTEASQETGQTEYLQATQLLRTKNGSADASEAVRLLWISVEKGYPNAELALAELYWHGKGVSHNCDQARILLSAAARKGSAEAEKRLQQFQQEGCE